MTEQAICIDGYGDASVMKYTEIKLRSPTDPATL